MKVTKSIIFLLSLSLFVQCKSVKLEKNPPFSVQSASYNHWSGGQPGVSGTKIALVFTAKKSVVFDSIYFQHKVVKTELQNKNEKQVVVGFLNTSKGQPVLGAKTTKPTAVKFPFKLQSNEAVISYKVNGKKNYFKIVNIKKVSGPFYQ